ncbi:MAG: hypothetical protein HGA66_03860 [Holophaga sp.]|nr:hypothetical protein [Holophaga sp.]
MKTLIAALAILSFAAARAEEPKKPAKAAACEKDACKDTKACEKKGSEKKKECCKKECPKDAKKG